VQNQIRIVRVITRLILGGPTTHVALLKEGLPESVYEQILIYGTPGQGEECDLGRVKAGASSLLQVNELVSDIHLWKDFIALIKMWRFLNKFKPEIVHTHTSKAGAIGRAAAFLAGVPIRVHTIHGHIHNGYFKGLKYKIICFIEKFLNKITTQLICVSKQVSDEYCSQFHMADKSKVCVIPLGLEFDEIQKKAGKEAFDLKKKFDLPDTSILVGIVGRMIPVKNHKFLVQIAGEILKTREDIHFFVIGDGETREECEKLSRELNLEKNLHFLGYQKNIALLYPELDIVVLTSKNEGTPLTLIEAQSFGVPVVAADVGGVSETIVNGESGFLVELDQPKEFERCLIRLADDGRLRERMGSAGSVFVRKNFSKGKLINSIDQLYQKLLKVRK